MNLPLKQFFGCEFSPLSTSNPQVLQSAMVATPIAFTSISRIPPPIPNTLQIAGHLRCCLKTPPPIPKPHHHNFVTPETRPHSGRIDPSHNDGGIPGENIKVLVNFKSNHNYIRVLQVSCKADHPFAGSRLLLLDAPGNIHSLSYLDKSLTETYFDAFAALPPILPPGPLAILGFGAGSAARLILELYPQVVIHGWELDPFVISVSKEFMNLSKIQKLYSDRLFVYIGNALNAEMEKGFAGILVDLFQDGCLIPELQDPNTWVNLKKKLRKGGRMMVNVGGSCVEPEDSWRDGNVLMEETLKAMNQVFPRQVFVLDLGNKKGESSIAMTGYLPDLNLWRQFLPKSMRCFVNMWKPYVSTDYNIA